MGAERRLEELTVPERDGRSLVVLSDVHLGAVPQATERSLREFLRELHDSAAALLVNGDLFDFWFTYSRVIPRRGFHVAAALARLAARLPVAMVGGNHDRWGGDFWSNEAALRFEPHRLNFEIGSRRVAAIHGDGLTEPRFRASLLHRMINHPITAFAYRWIHPEIGLRLVDAMSPYLGDHKPDEAKPYLDQAKRVESDRSEVKSLDRTIHQCLHPNPGKSEGQD